MPLDLAAVAFDGAFTAERELNNLHVSRLDPWVSEVAVLEHHRGDMYFPGLLIRAAIAAIAGPKAVATHTQQPTGAFGVLAELLKPALPADTSALMLVAESQAAEEFVSVVAPRGVLVIRRELSDEQVEQLRLAATRL